MLVDDAWTRDWRDLRTLKYGYAFEFLRFVKSISFQINPTLGNRDEGKKRKKSYWMEIFTDIAQYNRSNRRLSTNFILPIFLVSREINLNDASQTNS